MKITIKAIQICKTIINHHPRSGALLFFGFYSYNIMASLYLTLRNLFDRTKIDSSLIAPPSTSIKKQGVIIQEKCILGENVVITGRVNISPRCNIDNNCVIGGEGFQIYKFRQNCLSITHTGKVCIKDNVSIGDQSCIDRGLFGRKTFIGTNTRIGKNVHIGHNIKIGSNCCIGDGVTIGGNSDIGDFVVIGCNVVISNRISIFSGSIIAPNTVVTRNTDCQNQV